jgi:hypothetical protein
MDQGQTIKQEIVIKAGRIALDEALDYRPKGTEFDPCLNHTKGAQHERLIVSQCEIIKICWSLIISTDRQDNKGVTSAPTIDDSAEGDTEGVTIPGNGGGVGTLQLRIIFIAILYKTHTHTHTHTHTYTHTQNRLLHTLSESV